LHSVTVLQAVATGLGTPAASVQLITSVKVEPSEGDAREVFFVKQRAEVITAANLSTVNCSLSALHR
jgi:shikimate kinase